MALPTVPAAQNVQVPAFSPVTPEQYTQMQQGLWVNNVKQMDSMLKILYGTSAGILGSNTVEDVSGVIRQDYAKEAPDWAREFNEVLTGAMPEYMDAYSGLGARVNQGLEAGYDLGPELEREVQQYIRGAQTARGNWLGGAPTAQEAFGMGSAALDMYNTRIAQAQNFLGARSPVDLWGPLQLADPAVRTGFGAPAQTGQAYSQMANVSSASAFGSMVSANANMYGSYVSGLVGAANVNNQSAFDRYSAQFDQFLYKQSVQQGLYSQPSGGGSGTGAMIGGIASGVGAAASAAVAAICWIARKVMPDRWREFRRFLFTEAPEDFRRKYIHFGRKFAESLSGSDIARIRRAMERCLP